MFWILVAILTAAVAIVVTYPLKRSQATVAPERDGEVAVYRDQLAELERERASGLIGETEAEYARAEIGRRLLASAADAPSAKAALSDRRHGLIAAGVTALLPLMGLCLYLYMGSPNRPDMPLQARLDNPGNDMNLMIARAERHLAQNPDDGAGWAVLAPIYYKTMRLGDAEMAYRNAIRLVGEAPERLTGLGETLVAANQGIVVDDARTAFERAEALRPGNPRAQFYLSLALEQAGKAEEARKGFAAILSASPKGAPWIPLVEAHLRATGGAAEAAGAPQGGVAAQGEGQEGQGQGQAQAQQPSQAAQPPATADAQAPGNPSAADIAAAKDMAPADRQAMIAQMVESLDGKLKENPNNFEGWMRLVRSYAMLNEADKARDALKTGLKSFPAEGEEGRQLLALARELGLSPQGVTQ